MLSRLDQCLLVFILRLEFLLARNVADVANDKKLAVHVTELSRLDADLEQDVVFVHSSCSALSVSVRLHTTIYGRIICLGDLKESASLPILFEKVAEAKDFFYFYHRCPLLSIGRSTLFNGLLCLELIGHDSLHVHSLLRIKRLGLSITKEFLQVLVHEQTVHSDRGSSIHAVFSHIH